MNPRTLTLTAAAAAIVVSLGLAGCNKHDAKAVGDTADQAVAKVDDAARQLGNETKDAAQKVGDKIDDAVITASVKTELAKDSELSALRINVETNNGAVALRGAAPTMAAKEHATTLASAVKGVGSVDNQLTITAQ